MNKPQQVTLVGAIGLVIGAVLPWAKIASIFGEITKAGYEGDGIFTGIIGGVLILGALLSKGKPGKRYSVASSLVAGIAGLIALFDLINVSSAISDLGSEGIVMASVGAGLYITLLAALIAVVGGLQVVTPNEQITSNEE